jgi:L-malate glycosyltransferase
MKLLVVSHPCVVPINQDLFARVEARGNWEVSIVVPATWKSEYGPRRASRLPGFRGRLIELPVVMNGNLPLFWYRSGIGSVLARERPDAIYVHHEPYAAATWQVFMANDRDGKAPIGFYSAQNLAKRYPWPFSAAERWVHSKARFAFPVSRTVLSVLQGKGYRGPSRVLPLGIDTRRYRPATNAGDRRGPTIGFVGRVCREKGIDTFLEAVRLLASERVRALVVGGGEDLVPFQRHAGRLGLDSSITWAGAVRHEAMPAMYQRMDLLAVPSRTTPRWKEQFGRVVIEALACGVPVVTSQSGELPQLVAATDGGWTVPEGDAIALSRALRAAIRDPDARVERGRRGRRNVQQHFELDALAPAFMDAIEAAVG